MNDEIHILLCPVNCYRFQDWCTRSFDGVNSVEKCCLRPYEDRMGSAFLYCKDVNEENDKEKDDFEVCPSQLW